MIRRQKKVKLIRALNTLIAYCTGKKYPKDIEEKERLKKLLKAAYDKIEETQPRKLNRRIDGEKTKSKERKRGGKYGRVYL